MRALDFYLMGLWSALMALTASQLTATFLTALSCLSVLLALVASFRAFQRDLAARASGEGVQS